MTTLVWDQSPLALYGFNVKPAPFIASIVGYSGSPPVTLTAGWTSSNGSPSPFSSYSVNPSTGEISITLSLTDGAWGYGIDTGTMTGAADGLLELTVTVAGADCGNTLLVAITDSFDGSNYSDVAFGYGVPAPSNRWTNIRQAVES